MKLFVAGLLVDLHMPDRPFVLLIRKLRPDWQAGRLNLIGGKIEPNETPIQAMVREFAEETGYPTNEHDWREFCRLAHVSKDARVHFYVAYFDKDRGTTRSMTDEQIVWTDTQWLPLHRDQCIGNLAWLVPLALSNHQELAEVVDQSESLT